LHLVDYTVSVIECGKTSSNWESKNGNRILLFSSIYKGLCVFVFADYKHRGQVLSQNSVLQAKYETSSSVSLGMSQATIQAHDCVTYLGWGHMDWTPHQPTTVFFLVWGKDAE
jgi:hypothetical protein